MEQTGLVERWSGEGLARGDVLETRLQTPLLPGFDLDLRTLTQP